MNIKIENVDIEIDMIDLHGFAIFLGSIGPYRLHFLLLLFSRPISIIFIIADGRTKIIGTVTSTGYTSAGNSRWVPTNSFGKEHKSIWCVSWYKFEFVSSSEDIYPCIFRDAVQIEMTPQVSHNSDIRNRSLSSYWWSRIHPCRAGQPL